MRAALFLVFVAGCFPPAIGDGQVLCGSAGECPPGFSCSSVDGRCYRALPACVPLHCLIGWCGPISDGCGNTIDCGSCNPGGSPDMSGVVVSHDMAGCSSASPCTSGVCGTVVDGCGHAQRCGDCAVANTCSATKPNQCACVKRTCDQVMAHCGSYPDGCGGILSCGSCPSGTVCGGAGVANRCG